MKFPHKKRPIFVLMIIDSIVGILEGNRYQPNVIHPKPSKLRPTPLHKNAQFLSSTL